MDTTNKLEKIWCRRAAAMLVYRPHRYLARVSSPHLKAALKAEPSDLTQELWDSRSTKLHHSGLGSRAAWGWLKNFPRVVAPLPVSSQLNTPFGKWSEYFGMFDDLGTEHHSIQNRNIPASTYSSGLTSFDGAGVFASRGGLRQWETRRVGHHWKRWGHAGDGPGRCSPGSLFTSKYGTWFFRHWSSYMLSYVCLLFSCHVCSFTSCWPCMRSKWDTCWSRG
jgi:hypothetical protein